MKQSSGFTLIEVLIALIVLSGGLLGLAAMQAAGLQNNQIAYNRSQATQLAYDMADRMRANAANARFLALSTYITIVPNAALSQGDCVTASVTCSSTDLAQNDLYEWNEEIKAALPGCINANCGTITLSGSVFIITLTWDDNRDGDIDGDGGAADGDTDGDGDTDDDPLFQISLQL